ncbi:MAG: glycosyltransferase [Chloroflexota bacterium]|jgi:1,2-diacylglycerol 3-beta-galactosyltransferase
MEHYKILLIFSDTGGGHRSASEAIIEALNLEFGDLVSAEMVDMFKQYAPRPINHAPAWYPAIVRVPEIWELGYRLTDGRRRINFLNASIWPYMRRSMRAMISGNPSDLIVSVHPLANAPILRAMRGIKCKIPFATVVTDLVSTHAAWYSRSTDLVIVPTEEARQIAIGCHVSPEKVKVVGLPVADRCCQPPGDRHALRQQLSWQDNNPVVLLVGGGDGMGPLEQTAHAIETANLPVNLVVVCGRNQKLRERLDAHHWEIPTIIYGFVRQMPTFMQAADILVTKAGPGTICEALNAGLPMVLYSRLPGQEDGNVTYVTTNNAGIWAPRPDLIVDAIRNWIENPAQHKHAVEACQKLARPQSARQIARLLVELCRNHKPE